MLGLGNHFFEGSWAAVEVEECGCEKEDGCSADGYACHCSR